MNEMYLWLSAALVFLVLEMGHPGLFLFLSLSCGAVAGAVASWIGLAYVLQAAVALIVSMIAFVVMSYILRSKGLLDGHRVPLTNVYALIGKEGVVIADIESHGVGKVKVGGQVWSARGVHDVGIRRHALVHIIAVSGVHLIVQEK